MEIAGGTASRCQNTNRVSGGGNNGAVTTTYVALFRLEQRQIQFSSGSPLPVSDGDQVIVAGRRWRGELYADAVHNTATGFTRRTSIFSPIIMAVLVLAFFYFLTLLFGRAHPEVYYALPAPILGTIYLLWRAVQITPAWLHVRPAAP